MNRSTPGLPVHHQLPETTQTHVHWVGDTIQPSHPLSSCLLLSPIPPSIRVFSNESTLRMRWPKYWSFNFSISPSNEHLGLISFRMDWLVCCICFVINLCIYLSINSSYFWCSSVQFSRSVVSDSLRPLEPQHARPPCLPPTPGVHPNPCSLSRWCHPTISSSVVPNQSKLQTLLLFCNKQNYCFLTSVLWILTWLGCVSPPR